MKLSIIIPVFNEEKTILKVLDKVSKLKIPGWEKEIIIVDDCSTDNTKEIIKRLAVSGKQLVKIFHGKNSGKGAAIKTGIEKAGGTHIIIQDADLEYTPEDIKKLAFLVGKYPEAAVYCSRFLGKYHSTIFGHKFGNQFLTQLTNFLYHSQLSDMETCYKLIPRKFFETVKINSQRFDFEPEITAKLLKRGIKIVEVPISYTKRGFSEGKKIKWWRDGFWAVLALLRYRFNQFDNW